MEKHHVRDSGDRLARWCEICGRKQSEIKWRAGTETLKAEGMTSWTQRKRVFASVHSKCDKK